MFSPLPKPASIRHRHAGASGLLTFSASSCASHSRRDWLSGFQRLDLLPMLGGQLARRVEFAGVRVRVASANPHIGVSSRWRAAALSAPNCLGSGLTPPRCSACRLGFLDVRQAAHAFLRRNNLRSQPVNALNQVCDLFFLMAHQARIRCPEWLERLQAFLDQFGTPAWAEAQNAFGGAHQFLKRLAKRCRPDDESQLTKFVHPGSFAHTRAN